MIWGAENIISKGKCQGFFQKKIILRFLLGLVGNLRGGLKFVINKF